MVWRKAGASAAATPNDGSPAAAPAAGLTFTPAPQLMRATSGGSPASDSGAATVVETHGGGGGVDVQQVAEQVTRIIARQLVVEAERRGRSK
jgi:hypothetical protein